MVDPDTGAPITEWEPCSDTEEGTPAHAFMAGKSVRGLNADAKKLGSHYRYRSIEKEDHFE